MPAEEEVGMTLEITLLGTPQASLDGEVVRGIRGTKAWALLAFLVRADAPVPRERLAALLFPDAADPAAALRWNLSQLRRCLGVELIGDPVELVLPADARVDVAVLASGAAEEATSLPSLGEELLAGVWIDDDPAFEVWLEGERRHLRGMTAAVLREAALSRLVTGDATGAVELAERVVRIEPLDENAAVLLVRSLREAGRAADAAGAAEAASRRLREQLGIEPSAALWSAVHAAAPSRSPQVAGQVVVEAQLEAGEAALAAGAVDAGIDALREALGGSRADGSPQLLARSLCALGSALVHAVRGADQDALALLHEAVPLAKEAGMPALAARAERELGYVDLLRGRYERATRWLTQAADDAAADDEELAWVQTFMGIVRTDIGDGRGAGVVLDEAVARAQASDAARAEAMACSMRGRLRLLSGDLDGAAVDLDASVELAGALAWRGFQPWPQTLRAELVYLDGDLVGARATLERALATSRQVGDPCWEAMALRGLGLVAAAEDDVDQGAALLSDAIRQCRRLPDTYLWIIAYGLDALADLGTRRGLRRAADWVRALQEISSTHGMRPLTANAASYRERLGGAAEPARTRVASAQRAR